MLDIRRLRMLHEFAARGSIARTAEALGYTPSAVSQQLAVLEKEAGTPLLDRTARSAGLTDAGKRLAIHAERILAMVEAAESDLSAHAAQPSGRVVVTAFPSAAVAFAPALARSLKEHKHLTLLLREADPADGLQLVRSGEVEVAIVDDWTGRMSADLEAADGGPGVLSYYHLVRDPLILVVGRDHPAADPERPVDLTGGGRPAARRGRADPARPVGVRGPRHRRQPGRPRARHRDHAAARRRRLRAAGGGPRAAGRPRPGQGRVRGSAHRVGDPPVRRGDRRRAARRGQGDGPAVVRHGRS
jgi:DNA-binding transcriptional LysR family regulator